MHFTGVLKKGKEWQLYWLQFDHFLMYVQAVGGGGEGAVTRNMSKPQKGGGYL